jgi:hypothetical protein
MRRHKDAYSGAEQIFEVSASISYPLRKVITTGKLPSIVWLIVVITVEHDLKASLGNTHTEVFDQRLVLM